MADRTRVGVVYGVVEGSRGQVALLWQIELEWGVVYVDSLWGGRGAS